MASAEVTTYTRSVWWERRAPRSPDVAPSPTPCPTCGERNWTSQQSGDGTVKQEAKCNRCGFERDIVHDPFTGPKAASAEEVSPWETHRPAIFKLRWFFSQSDGDLGAHSSWESKVQLANFGASYSPAIELIFGEPTAATPSDAKLWAARRWAGIAAVLKACRRPTHGLFEYVYSLRRPNTQMSGLFDRETEPIVSYLVATRQLALRDLQKPSDRARVKATATELLEAALREFEDREAELRPPNPEKPSRRGSRAQAAKPIPADSGEETAPARRCA